MRKIKSMKSSVELRLDGKSASTVAVHRYTIPVLVTAARNGELKKLSGVGNKIAEEIFAAVDKAGFILHESKTSLGIRNLLAAAFYFPLGTAEEYEARTEFTEQQAEKLFKLLETLTEQEVEVLKLRFGLCDAEPLNRKTVADMLMVTRERVRQIEAKAFRKLRNPARKKVLQEIFPAWPGFDMEIPRRTGSYDGLVEEMPIEELPCLSVRAYNCLTRARIRTVGQLIQHTYAEIEAIRNMTHRDTENVVASLLGAGYELKAESDS